jgi:ATP-dependent RNA helicase RhlE
MTEQNSQSLSSFENLGIAPAILKIIEEIGLKIPTPIQRKSIPVAIEGKDLIGIAQTGTGKTFAFGIPMVQRLALYKGRGLILLPTRELALQVDENLKKIGRKINLRTVTLIGGEPIGRQIAELKKRPHIIVATPGRLNDILDRKIIRLNEVKILVLDEADMMFDMGFAPQIRRILLHVPKERQTMLFSATIPLSIAKLASEHMTLPINIEVAPSGTAAENVDQEIYIIKKEDRLMNLENVLKKHKGSVLVFSRTKHGARSLARSVQLMGHTASEIHSNRSLAQRREALQGFKSGRFRVLVATDIAARGIDVKEIELVLNYDMPDSSEDYVHRIGRTGRAGKEGKAITFALPSQGKDIKDIERLINKDLAIVKFAELDRIYARPAFKRRPYGASQGSRAFAPRRFTGRR